MALLFSQIAVAAYACPAMGERQPGAADTMAMAGMPCAEMMAAGVPLDPEQPTLCMQHCQFGTTTQVVDHVLAGLRAGDGTARGVRGLARPGGWTRS